MSFLNKLTKGFIRSAVNQVGRDGGRIVSRKLYDAKLVSSEGLGHEEQGVLSPSDVETRANIIKQGYKAVLLESSPIMYFFILVSTIVIPIVGPTYWLITFFKNLFKNKTNFYYYVEKPIYVSDRRYSTGQRYEGSKRVKQIADVSLRANHSEKIIFVLKALLALSFGIATAWFQYMVYENW